MLKYMLETIHSMPSSIDKLRDLLVEYRHILTSNGFIVRGQELFNFNSDINQFTVGGILTHSDYELNENEYSGRAQEIITKLLDKRKEISMFADRYEICYSDVICSEHLYPCEHKEWRGLIIASNWPWSVSPIICEACKGFVAPFKLPITNEIAEAIWGWHVQSDCVEQCWSVSGELESWADSERHHHSSNINELGRSIVTMLRSECGIASWLYIPARNEFDQNLCPRCEDKMTRVKSNPAWNFRCETCGIAR